MKLIFSDESLPTTLSHSIFLAGPSPRDKHTLDWRVQALEILESLGFKGEVFIPIPRNKFYGQDDDPSWTYTHQIEWECAARQMSDKILFWVARDIEGKMPGFTTNVEFGEDLNSGKLIYGRPDSAQKCRYLDKRIEDKGQSVYNDLATFLKASIEALGLANIRQGGECFVPLFIWRTDQFQSWYQALQLAGNRLDWAEVEYVKMVGKVVFAYSLKVHVWVEVEKRLKSNEFIFSRKDISSVLAYYVDDIKQDVAIVLVKEFRSPVANKEGFVYELPGGSSFKPAVDPKQNAQHELHEETGILIENTSRFEWVSTRQIVATLCTHQAHLYRVRLSEKEFNEIQSEQSFGMEEDSEKTYVQILWYKDVKKSLIDYATLGMITEALIQ